MLEAQKVLSGEQRWCVEHASMLDLLAQLPEKSIDSCCSDPPYELGMMAKDWDRSGIAFQPDTWARVLRVLKPGAHLVAFGGTRTFHRVACAIEDGGFEIRDDLAVLSWIYSTGFPKSVQLADGIGTGIKPSWEPIIVARRPLEGTLAQNYALYGTGGLNIEGTRVAHASAADRAAHQAQVEAIKARGGSMDGSWKNASDLSKANDVHDAGRWPPNLALVHTPWCRQLGTRAVRDNPTWATPNRECEPSSFTGDEVSSVQHTDDVESVWLCVPGCPVRDLTERAGTSQSRSGAPRAGASGNGWSMTHTGSEYDDEGSRARYFPQFEYDANIDDLTPFYYCSKPPRSERDAGLHDMPRVTGGKATGRKDGSAGTRNPRAGAGRTGGVHNVHPTTKPASLMRWLVRLVTPTPNGVVLDPFTGSGTTGIATMLEGKRFVGVELYDTKKEPYVRIARARIAHAIGIDPHAPRVLSEDPGTGLKQLNLFALGKNEP